MGSHYQKHTKRDLILKVILATTFTFSMYTVSYSADTSVTSEAGLVSALTATTHSAGDTVTIQNNINMTANRSIIAISGTDLTLQGSNSTSTIGTDISTLQTSIGNMSVSEKQAYFEDSIYSDDVSATILSKVNDIYDLNTVTVGT